ncbi:MAG: tetratricopeptide repeat protein [Verrucomicrobiota bacterium JB023]|nr:tetratricopeptide repeat protein [Verrucomicrobiota bacterium JB023]
MDEQATSKGFPELGAEELDPSLQGYWKKAKETVDLNNHKYAVTLLQAILKEAPGFVEGRELLRECESKLTGGPKKKKGLFGTSVGAGTVSVSRKYLSMAQKDPNGALQAVEKELEKDPHSPALNDALHDVAVLLEMPQTAAMALENVRASFPEEGKILHKLADFYMGIERPLDAAKVYEDIAKANPADIDAVKGAKDATAKASMLQNRSKDGSVVLQKRDADETLALEKASRAAMTKEQMEERRDELLASYGEDQNNINVVRDLAAIYENLEDWANARAFYDWGFQLSNNDVALKSKADKMKDKADAKHLKELQDYVAANPDDADAKKQLEDYRAELSAVQVAEGKRRVEENPTDPTLRFQLGEALFNSGEYREAIQHLQQATRNPHIRIKVLILLGRTFEKMGMTDMAVSRLSEANEELRGMDDTKKEVLYELGSIYDKMGDKAKATECFKQIYEVDYGYRDVAQRVESAYGS